MKMRYCTYKSEKKLRN